MKKIILLVISFVTVSCGGGGGGGSTPTPTDPGGGTVGPSYTKITGLIK
mgnify:CR=1 FL=1